MFIGHLPAGYIISKTLKKFFKNSLQKFNEQVALILGLIASVFPDVDVFYFYLIDNRQHSHHSYWTHRPIYWFFITILTLLLLFLSKKKQYIPLATIFFINIFGHLFLDTIVGEIEWLYPFSQKSYAFFKVPNVYNFWIFNFIFHWSFSLEILVITYAVWLWIKEKSENKPIMPLQHNKNLRKR